MPVLHCKHRLAAAGVVSNGGATTLRSISRSTRLLKAQGHDLRGRPAFRSYENYLSPTRLTERIDLVGSQVKGEIDQVMAMIDAAVGSATSYTESLAGASASNSYGSKDRETVCARSSKRLVQTTKAMEAIQTGNWKSVSHASKLEINDTAGGPRSGSPYLKV